MAGKFFIVIGDGMSIFPDLESAIRSMREEGKKREGAFLRCFEAKEVFNSDGFDFESINKLERG